MKKYKSTSRRFHLLRTEDVSGVSGTGVVAEGIEYSSGWVSLQFISQYACVEIAPSMKVVEEVHSHGGKTTIVWDDK